MIEAVSADASPADRQRLRDAVAELDARSRPIAAALLIDRLNEAPAGERAAILQLLREAGRDRGRAPVGAGEDGLAAFARLRRPRCRRCARGGASLEELLHDRNHHVREAAVEALGAIGEPASLPALREIYLAETVARPGIVYAALVEFGPAAVDIFAEGIRSENPRVRASACFGLAGGRPRRGCPRTSVSFEPIEHALADAEPAVRIAAADALATVGDRPGAGPPVDTRGRPRAARPARLDARARRLRRPPSGARRRRCVAGRASARSRSAPPSPSCCWRRKPRGGPAAARALAVEDVWPVETARILEEINAL